MIKIVDGNLFDSKANFIVHQVNCQGVMGGGVALQVAEKYPHIEIAYRKYLQHCKKNNIKPLGTVQFVPVDVWAMAMVNNNTVMDYDKNYQYIVNLFGQDSFGMGECHTDLKALRTGFTTIRDTAVSLGASVAMPYKIGSFRGGASWDDVYSIIENVFKDSAVNVEIWKLDLG